MSAQRKKGPWSAGPWRIARVSGQNVLVNGDGNPISYVDMPADSPNGRVLAAGAELADLLDEIDDHLQRGAVPASEGQALRKKMSALLARVKGKA